MDFNIGSAIGGAISGIAGNVLGASSANKGLKKQIKFLKKSEDRAYAERERGRTAALQYVTPYTADLGAREYIGRQMNSHPEVLAPGQKIALDDAMRNGTARLAATGLRGAGRSQAVLGDTEARLRAQFYDQNQDRADLAARELAAQGEQAASNAANIETGTAGANAAGIMDTGAAVGGAYGDAGANNANSIIGSASLAGQTLGAIGALSSRDSKALKSYPTLAYQV